MTISKARLYLRIVRQALLPGAAFILGLAATAAPSSGADFKVVEPGYLTVTVFSNGPPVIVYGENDEFSGVDGDLLTSFAEQNSLKIRLYKTTFASSILAVAQGKADVGTWYYYTPERARQVYYTAPFLKETASVFTMKPFEYHGPSSLEGKRVGAIVGMVFANHIQEALGSSAQLYPDGVSARTALLNGQIDAYVDSSFVAFEEPFAGNSDVTARVIKTGELGMPESVTGALDYNFVRCDNKGLADAINAELKRLIDSGKWTEILAANGLTEESLAPSDMPEQLCQ